jgi:hypothetical protein
VRKPSPDELLSTLVQVEELARSPAVADHIDRAAKLALSIARNAPTGAISNLAMKLMSAIHALPREGESRTAGPDSLSECLLRVRSSLQDCMHAARRVDGTQPN